MTTPPAGIFDELTNIYTLIVKPDLSFKILVNLVVLRSGNLLYDFEPPINPPKEIDDPTDKKPSDWVDLSKYDFFFFDLVVIFLTHNKKINDQNSRYEC